RPEDDRRGCHGHGTARHGTSRHGTAEKRKILLTSGVQPVHWFSSEVGAVPATRLSDPWARAIIFRLPCGASAYAVTASHMGSPFQYREVARAHNRPARP